MVYSSAVVAQKLEDLNSGLLKGHYIFNSDSYDNQRFSAPEKYSRNISYDITEDRDLIDQYLSIRQEIYRQSYNDPNVGEDYTDKVSHIFVARAGAGNVIGGLRLTISAPNRPNILPIELSGVNIRSLFPQIDFDKVTFGEASRLAVLPDFRDGAVSDMLLMNSKEYFVREMGAEIGFGCSTMAHIKKFSRFINRLGYNFIIRQDVNVKVASSDAELYLWAIDFTSDARFSQILQGEQDLDVANLQLEKA